MATDPVVGLTSAEVAERVARGQANAAPDARSRSLGDIVRANTFTWFNGLIGTLWVIMLVVAPIQDSLFGFVIVANTAIGIIQEYRAARTLAKLAVLGEARPLVRRDGADVEVSPHDVVLDDLVVLRTGDQLVVDGVIVACDGLEIDESLLTGEADPVDKAVGDDAMSGSFVVAGSGTYQATRVGRDSFASGLTEEAKKFHLTNSELRDAINGFIRGISFLLLPVGLLLLWSQVVRTNLPLDEAIRGTIAGVVTMIPEGLVLLTSIAMAVSVIRLAQKKVLVQDMPAVEVLARVDTICVDKTGTLTEPGMRVRDVVPIGAAVPELDAVLGAMGASEDSPNPTLAAIAEHYPSPGWAVTASVPFSSARKWSAASFDGHGTWLLGAPEILAAGDRRRAPAGGREGGRRSPGAAARAVGRAAVGRRRSGADDRGRARRHQPAAAPGRGRDRRVLPRAGRHRQGDLRRQRRDGRGHRPAGRGARRRPTPSTRAACPPTPRRSPTSWPARTCSAGSPRRRSSRWSTRCTPAARRSR